MNIFHTVSISVCLVKQEILADGDSNCKGTLYIFVVLHDPSALPKSQRVKLNTLSADKMKN